MKLMNREVEPVDSAKSPCKLCRKRLKTWSVGANGVGFCSAPLKKPKFHTYTYDTHCFCFITTEEDDKLICQPYYLTIAELACIGEISMFQVQENLSRKQDEEFKMRNNKQKG